MRLEKKNIHMNKIVKSETVIFFVSREERIMDAYNRWRCYKRKSDYGKRNN